VQAYYGLDGVRELMVTLQWFENEQQEILRSGLKDPKQFYAHGMDFHQHGGNRWWQRLRREPQAVLGEANKETRFGRCILRIQRCYGAWCRFKCRQLGPLEAANQVILYATLGWIPRAAAPTWLWNYHT
jgi:hypothetical protein